MSTSTRSLSTIGQRCGSDSSLPSRVLSIAASSHDHAGTVVGFILVGPGADDTAPEGEVYAINVDPHHWGGGAGTLLLDAGTRALTEEGFTRAVLWVHPGNRRARRFYEARGWSADDAERTQDVLGVTVPEARYVRPLP